MVEYGQHQKDAIAFQQVANNSILAMQTGTGKSVTTIGSELLNLHNKKLDKCIFVCTKGSLGEVLNDYNKFYNFQPKQLYDVNTIQDFFNSESNVAVTRYEWLKHFDEKMMRQLTRQNKLGMWWDEAQRLKNGSRDDEQTSGTQAHKKAKELRQFCDAFHLVTATPIMTTLDDLWSLMHLVEPKVLGKFSSFAEDYYERELVIHPKYAKRTRKYCPNCHAPLFYDNGWIICPNRNCRGIWTPNGPVPFREKVRSIYELVEYKNLIQLSNILKSYMFCFFPEQDINYIIHNFDLQEDTDYLYMQIARDTVNRMDNGEPTPFSTRMIELQYVVDRSYEKKAELWKLANQLKSKGFVLYTALYNTEGSGDQTTLDHIQAVLDKVEGLSYRAYSGRESDEDKDKNKKWFQEDPKNKCLIITEAGGASLNLQVTNEFVFYNLPYGFGKMSQAFGRVVRLFSSFKTFNIHFIQAKHSIDVYKYTGFLMYEEVMKQLMNNKLINTSKPISFNSHIKSALRQDLLWRTGV